MINRPLVAALGVGLFLVVSCGKPATSSEGSDLASLTKNLVEAGEHERRLIGEGDVQVDVLAADALAGELAAGRVLAPERASRLLDRHVTRRGERSARAARDQDPGQDTAQGESLLVGLPMGLLGEQQLFGGVVTKVSRHEDEDLGMLKLADLPPFHVKPELVFDGLDYHLGLYGCAEACNELSDPELIVAFPVVGVSQDGASLFVDLAPFGRSTNLAVLLDASLEESYEAVQSRTATVDYSGSTLVFDIESTMRDKAADEAARGEDFLLTARWYLRSASAANPFFVPRRATPEVGYFTTMRGASELITRFSVTSTAAGAPVKYYLKTIPEDVRPAFESALTEWNDLFEQELGRKLLSWEYVDRDDPRADVIVAGDIRYNVIEWDLVNAAPYGGLGPSIASQASGEILSANVLIQGPLIVDLYKAWFKVSDEARALRAAGREAEAERVHAEGAKALARRLEAKRPRLVLEVEGGIPLRVPAQMPGYADRAMSRQDFFETPVGETYGSYMTGYWHELVAHEVGHNLGLRHNFRGNLGATTEDRGKVSRSVMEYLNRTIRHKNGVAAYDRMAIAYGYKGAQPIRADWFCTDEHVVSSRAPGNSPECSRDDLGSDPFGWFESLLARSVRHVVRPDSADAPLWTTEEIASQAVTAVTGLAAYAGPAAAGAHRWTNWGASRPSDAAGIRAYVTERLKSQWCNDAVQAAIAAKATDEARELAAQNLAALVDLAGKTAAPFGLTAEALACGDAAAE